MNIRFIKTTLYMVFALLIVNCYIGSSRDACRYNLKEGAALGPSPEICEFMGLTAFFTQSEDETVLEFEAKKNAAFNYSLINCIEYYQKLKECDKEEKKYFPSLYGYNFKILISYKDLIKG